MIVPLNADTESEALLGGKASGILRLLRAGARVPLSVCIPPESEVEEAVDLAMEWFGNQEAKYAVRSSGFGEDGLHQSFAGQLDSFLRVKGRPGLVEAVEACRASGSNERVLSYAGKAIPVSVLVQTMVEADFAGVLFTCDPVTGSRNHVVLEVVAGTAEHLVGGTVAATTMTFGRDANLRAQHGPELDFAVQEVVREALELESSLGAERPLDFEWAVVDGIVWWLQVRPATAFGHSGAEVYFLNPGEQPEVGEDETHWTSVNAREALPGAVTPISQDLCRSMIKAGLISLAERLGAQLPAEPVVDFFNNRAFLSVTGFFKLARSLPLENPEALVHQLLTGAPEQARLKFRWSLLPRLLKLIWEVVTLGSRFQSLEAAELHKFGYLTEPENKDSEDLLAELNELLEMRELFSYHALGSGVYSHLYSQIEELCCSYGETASDTLQGLGSLRFGSSAAALRELAAKAPSDLLEAPEKWAEDRDFAGALEQFIGEYGHLGDVSLEPAQPPGERRPSRY